MAHTADTVQFLHRVPLFQGFNNRQLGSWPSAASSANSRRARAWSPRARAVKDSIVIVSGKAEAVRERSDGDEGRREHVRPHRFLR